jgi:hypothetical protein
MLGMPGTPLRAMTAAAASVSARTAGSVIKQYVEQQRAPDRRSG